MIKPPPEQRQADSSTIFNLAAKPNQEATRKTTPSMTKT
jgi:hypothetical protein